MDRPVIDHRSAEFAALGKDVLGGMQRLLCTTSPVIIFPSSGTGAWEAAIVNTLSPGDRVLLCETGHFSQLWGKVANRFGLHVDCLEGDWRTGADPDRLYELLRADNDHQIKAVMIVHNETSTGVTSRIPAVRAAVDACEHPALLMVDTISSLGSIDYRHDEWNVDVTIAGSQKGLMLPPGLSMNAISEKALVARRSAGLPRSYWDWDEMLKHNGAGFFPYTPATTLLYGLQESLRMLFEEGLSNVFARHDRHARATRAAAQAWGLELVCTDAREYSSALTAVFTPEGHDADLLRQVILKNFDMSLGAGLSKLSGKVFRIGHLGSFNDLMLLGTLSGIEMGMRIANVPHHAGGLAAALDSLVSAVTRIESCAQSI
jgi:alanine-glyoxylate transaminase/serine-glyoxylate transaminase/serine-pyruvate transaminase